MKAVYGPHPHLGARRGGPWHSSSAGGAAGHGPCAGRQAKLGRRGHGLFAGGACVLDKRRGGISCVCAHAGRRGKLPCVHHGQPDQPEAAVRRQCAREICGTEVGTPENDIVSTLSVATSSLVTVVVLMLGVLCLVPLTPVLESPVLQPAFDTVIPALFGALAFKYFSKAPCLRRPGGDVRVVRGRARADWAGVVPYPAGRRAFHCAGVADVPQGAGCEAHGPGHIGAPALRREKRKREENAAFPAQQREKFLLT